MQVAGAADGRHLHRTVAGLAFLVGVVLPNEGHACGVGVVPADSCAHRRLGGAYLRFCFFACKQCHVSMWWPPPDTGPPQ